MTASTLVPLPRGRDEDSARDRLLAAALERFARQGAAGVTLDAVRRDAGVSVGALYHHFPDKAALAAALYVQLTEAFQAGFAAQLRRHSDAEAAIKAGVRFHLRWVTANRAGARVLLGERPDDAALRALNREFLAEVMAWWQTHVHYGALRALPVDLVNALWLGPAQEYARHWLGGRARRVPSSVAETLAQAAWSVLKEDP
jgi:AcrR family transcriptional regulator